MKKPTNPDNVYYEYPLKTNQPEFISKIWSFKSKTPDREQMTFSLLPDYTATLLNIRSKDNPSKNKLAVLGPCSVNSTLITSDEVLLIGYRFRPGLLASALGLEAVEIKDKLIDCNKIKALDNYSILVESLNSTTNLRSMIKYLNELTSEISLKIRYPGPDMVKALELMVNSGGNVRESAVVEKLTIGKRQFQRKFLDTTGLSPKEFCGLVRLHLSTRELATGNGDQYDVLVNAGYYDQSHYYREFKKLMGVLPTAFVSRQKNIKYGRLEK